MKIKFLPLILLQILILITLNGCTEAPTMTVNLAFGSNRYESQESIIANVTVTNVSDMALVINSCFNPNDPVMPEIARDITFLVRNPQGEELDFLAKINPAVSKLENFVLLTPGVQLSTSIDISRYYDFSLSGEYEIYVSYQNTLIPDNMNNAWVGNVQSELVVLEIVEN